MPFVYRLQKILDFRIRKKEEQLMVVQRAQQEVNIAEQNIAANNSEIELIKQNQKIADSLMLDSYDKYLHHLWEKAKQLEEIRLEKESKLRQEKHKLVQLEQAVKVLEKHKDKNKEAYLEEEKKAELKQFSEIAVQKYFQKTKQAKEDEELLSLEEIKLVKGEK